MLKRQEMVSVKGKEEEEEVGREKYIRVLRTRKHFYFFKSEHIILCPRNNPLSKLLFRVKDTKWTLIFRDSLRSNVFAYGSLGEAREAGARDASLLRGSAAMTLI